MKVDSWKWGTKEVEIFQELEIKVIIVNVHFERAPLHTQYTISFGSMDIYRINIKLIAFTIAVFSSLPSWHTHLYSRASVDLPIEHIWDLLLSEEYILETIGKMNGHCSCQLLPMKVFTFSIAYFSRCLAIRFDFFCWSSIL